MSFVAVDQRSRGVGRSTAAPCEQRRRSVPGLARVRGRVFSRGIRPSHLLTYRETMTNSHIVTRRITFTYLNPDDDWQAIGRISATLSWCREDPLAISLVLSAISNSRRVMARDLLLDGLVCQYPGGVGDGCCYWVPWNDKNVVLELQLPHGDYIMLRARRSALESFLAATVYHEFSDPFALETWHQFKRSDGRPNDAG